MIVMRSSISLRVGQTITNDKNIPTNIVKRQIYWRKAIEYASITNWKNDPEPWKYFYYEVEPVGQRNQEKAEETLPSS